MSSSSRRPSAGAGAATHRQQPADGSAPSSSAPDSRRWSRNLSSRRHRELERLNEIERRRQLLELRRQNDLLGQMSVTAATATTATHLSAGAAPSGRRRLNDHHQRGPERAHLPKDKGGQPLGTAPSCLLADDANDGTGAQGEPRAAAAPASSLQDSWELEEPEEEEEEAEADGSESVGSFSEIEAPARQLMDEEQDDDDDDDELAGSAARVGATAASGAPQQVSPANNDDRWLRRGPEAAAAGARKLISGHLEALVARPVPRNRRFLCWIVREKVSKLSKARPYFYPTYYLYIQSILEVQVAPPVVGPLVFDESLAGSPGEHQPLSCHSSPADNSGASNSSISADMLFMEALQGSKIGGHRLQRAPIARRSYSDTGEAPNYPPAATDELDAGPEAAAKCFFDEPTNPYVGANEILLAARRRKKTKTYLIGPGESGYARKHCICKLKSNVLGTNFNASLCSAADATAAANSDHLDQQQQQQQLSIASIAYETNVLGFRGPRKMRVFLPKPESCNQRTKELPELFKRKPKDVIHLKNMTPCWNIESQSYVLNFNGRVTQASVKNFQLIECERDLSAPEVSKAGATGALSRSESMNNPSSDINSNSSAKQQTHTYNNSIVMQFGRISNHEFTCDIAHPLSLLQGFAIALSSLDSKLACE